MQRALQARKNEIKNHEIYCNKKQKARELENKLAINKEKGNIKDKQKTKKSTNQMTISN